MRSLALRASSFTALAVLLGCSPVLEPRPTSSALWPSEPTVVTGRVLELKAESAWIDFDEHFISYDSVVIELSAPAEASGKLAHLQFQGEPVVGGKRIGVGQTIRFVLPTAMGSHCCEPYLEDIVDLEVLPDGR